jgi:hypothetical protein
LILATAIYKNFQSGFAPVCQGDVGGMPDVRNGADMTAPAEQRRLGREKRRDAVNGVRQTSHAPAPARAWRSEIANVADYVRGRAIQASPPRAATFGAVVGMVAGLLAADRKTNDGKDGNVVSGDVAVHLLNRIELLTIRLQVRHARGRRPTEIDVHRVEADASSRASSSS